ncbi:MAG: DUF2169 domain-containing protein [Pikeienuella sp.]
MRDQDLRTFWCVWIKATFQMRNDRRSLFVADQDPVRQAPLFIDGDPDKVLVADTDVSLPRAQVDVILDAVGRAPGGDASRMFNCVAEIGDWRKSVDVSPPSVWSRRGKPEPVRDVVAEPVRLDYANAFGGAEVENNPVGVGYYADMAAAEGKALPRLAPPDRRPRRPDRIEPPAAFSAIPRQWPARERLGGTYDEQWSRRRSPLLPADLDPEYWQSAPEDQRISRDAIADRILLTNMVPEDESGPDGRFTGTIPRLGFEVATRFDGRWVQGEMALQSIFIAADTRRLSLTYMATHEIGATQNDVLVDRTFVALRSHEGFLVRGEDAACFDPARDKQQVKEVA